MPFELERYLPLPSSMKDQIEAVRLKKKSFRWGYDLYQREIEEGLSSEEVDQLIAEAKETGLYGSEIYIGYNHHAIKTANQGKKT